MEGQNEKEPDWLADYIRKSYTPSIKDFQRLRGEVAKRRRKFESVYRPIRHKLIAHSDKKYLDKADELWAETNIGVLEEIIWFLHDLKEVLFDTYHNGRKPVLTSRKPDIEFYESDFGSLLDFIRNT